ncbi:PCI-domain-containing protein [Obba rivulosa]|uniref:Eukaryotic translation initiation factor 3 subunit M n=1 Tax=Obba rivulosa TaxID=1052685 RepID=A0A8E2DU84_9APHY|nr:PCI-domain-containing protein [Obba rivulosa]
MAVSDSVSVFAEGTFSEQIRELVDYLVRSVPEEERSDFVQQFDAVISTPEGGKPIEEDEERRRAALTKVVLETKRLRDGSEKETEGFFNLLFAHLLTQFSPDSHEIKEHVAALLPVITSSPEAPPSKYRILSNLFNAIPRHSSLRLPVYKALLELAAANDDLDRLGLSRAEVEKWLQEWDVSPEEKSELLKAIADAYAKCGESTTSFKYTLAYVRSLQPPSQDAAVDAIVTALRLPTFFDFDPLFRIDAVVAAKDHELFSLLQIFLNEGLPQYKVWEESHADTFAKYSLDKAQLERKIRLLSLATLGFQNIGRDMPYSVVAETLQVDVADVERWVIDVIRAGLISGRLSQIAQTLHVTRATPRFFEREQWELLQKRLQAWKTGLADVLEVVAAARKKNEGPQTGSSSGLAAPVAAPQVTAA